MTTDNEAMTSTIRVRDELREAILDGSLAPGARLRAEAIASRLSTSRTPVREAFMLLAREGLVDIQPRRGAVVSSFDVADIVAIFEVRRLIEPRLARRAAERVSRADVARLGELCDLSEQRGGDSPRAVEDQIAYNDEFHRIIVDAADSRPLSAALRAAGGVPSAFSTALWNRRSRLESSQFCHRQLALALAENKPDLAESVMHLHMVSAVDSFVERDA
jgi:DNA-binding GntR family transcriptional regulator